MSDEGRDEERARDADLLGRVRDGDQQAYAELWVRYAPAAIAVARTYWWSTDADDLVAEAFTRIFQAIQAGKGPTAAFKPYLFATMRNLAASWGRSRREVPIDYIETVEDPATTDVAADADFDASLVSQAILALPERWQDVLWLGEVEHLSMQDIGQRLGISERAAAVLAFRAREGLRQAWITAHVAARPPGSRECQWTLGKLGAHARRRLTPRDTARIHAHLDECAECRAKAAEARHAGSRMLSVLFPAGITVGAGAQVWQSFTTAGLIASATPLPPAVAAPVAALAAAKGALGIAAGVAAMTLAAALTVTVLGSPAVVAPPAAAQVVTRTPPLPTVSPSVPPATSAPVAPPAPVASPAPSAPPPAPAPAPSPPPAPEAAPAPSAPSQPVLLDIPAQVSRTQLASVTVSCEAGADLAVSAFGITLAAGVCDSDGRWWASIPLAAFPVPPGTSVTLSFAQSNGVGTSGQTSAEVLILD